MSVVKSNSRVLQSSGSHRRQTASRDFGNLPVAHGAQKRDFLLSPEVVVEHWDLAAGALQLHRIDCSAQVRCELFVRHRAEKPDFGGFPRLETRTRLERGNTQGFALIPDLVFGAAEAASELGVVHCPEQSDFACGPDSGTGRHGDPSTLAFGDDVLNEAPDPSREDRVGNCAKQLYFG